MPDRLETRLKANRERTKPTKSASNIKPKPLKTQKQLTPGQKGAAKTNDPKAKRKEYNPPDHDLTDTEALQFHLMYIRDHDQETVSGYLPDNMRIDKRGTIRYKRGQAPNALAQLKKNHGRFKDNPQDLYNNINNNNSNGRNNSTKGLKTLKRYYQEKLNSQGEIQLDGETFQDTWGKLLVMMQVHMLKKLIKKPDSFELANRILTDLRLNAGEIPAQEIDVEVKQSHYHEFDLSGLLEQAGKVLERHQVPQIADIKADNAEIADYEVIDNGTDKAKDKELGQ